MGWNRCWPSVRSLIVRKSGRLWHDLKSFLVVHIDAICIGCYPADDKLESKTENLGQANFHQQLEYNPTLFRRVQKIREPKNRRTYGMLGASISGPVLVVGLEEL